MVNLEFLKPLWGFCKRHATKILCGLAIGTEAAAIYCTAKEAPIVKERLEELGPDATNWQKIKTAGKIYLPAAGFMLVSMGSIIGGTVIGDHRLQVADGLLSLSNATIAGYQKKLVDAVGKEKAQEVEDQVAQQLMHENPPEVSNVISTGMGDQLIFDPLSGRYFTHDLNKVIAAANKINKRIICEIWVPVNEWYAELGLDEVGLGNTSGWNTDNFLEIPNEPKYFMTQMTEDGRSCAVITYYNRPIRYK